MRIKVPYYFIGLVSIFFVVLSCTQKEETYWDSIVHNEESTAVAMLFTSTLLPPAGTFGPPLLDSIREGLISGINPKQVHCISLYPQVTDPLYNPKAETLLFRYNDAGDDTFEDYPSFVNNFQIFNFDIEGFKQSIRDFQAEDTPIGVGAVLTSNGKNLDIYISLKYLEQYSKDHGIVVYLYRKEKTAPQKVLPNTEQSDFVHKNLLIDFITPDQGQKIVGTYEKDWENRYELRYAVEGEDIENIGVLTYVCELDASGKFSRMINSYSN